MFAQLKTIHQRWMKLDPPHQYMAWTVLGVMFSGVALIALSLLVPAIDGYYMPYVIIGVGLSIVVMTGVFVSAIIYLTVVWPHYYDGYVDPLVDDSKADSKEAEVILENSNFKLCMALEDPEDTLRLIEGKAGKSSAKSPD